MSKAPVRPEQASGITSHRPVISARRHVISAGHYLAAHAGFAVLEAGGNAIDAGVAAGIALGVLQSDIVNVAGVAPIQADQGGRKLHEQIDQAIRLVDVSLQPCEQVLAASERKHLGSIGSECTNGFLL